MKILPSIKNAVNDMFIKLGFRKETGLSLAGLISFLINRPLTVNPAALQFMISVLCRLRYFPSRSSGAATRGQSLSFLPEAARNAAHSGGLSIITVRGFLFHRLQSFGPFSFHTYDYIRAQFRSALSDPEVKAIIFDIDSPGGEAAGAFDLADDIYQARGSKPVYAVANETAYSAAYAIASAADKVYIPRTGSVGSIGLIAVHTDQSRFDEKIGLTYTPIFAGSRKNDFTPHEPLSAKARDAGQSMVDDVYDIFVETVARNRNMTIADIRKTEAALYMGEGAVNAGLVDKVMSWNDVLGDVGQKIFGNKSVSLFNKKKEAIGLCENRSKPFREIETARKEIEEEVRAWVTSILETCSIAKMEKMAIDLIKSEVSLEEARKKIVNAKAAEAERTQIRSTVGALSTGAVNPLIENAKKIAAEALKKPQM